MLNQSTDSSSIFVTRHTRAIAFFDISGSTTLWHETKVRDFDTRNAVHQKFLSNALGSFLESAVSLAQERDLIFVNTTGDGFVIASHPTHWSPPGGRYKDPNYHPCQIVYYYYISISDAFRNLIEAPIHGLKYICANTISLRVALHHGWVYRLKNSHENLFFGDSLNYAARILDTRIAREGLPACSFSFFKRFHRMGSKDPGQPEETIWDRNRYPEPIPVYNLHDPEQARYRIERVRHFLDDPPERLVSTIFNVQKIRKLLGCDKADPIADTKSPFSISYSFVPQGETNSTSVKFTVEQGHAARPGPEKAPVKLRVLHKGFEHVATRSWIRELASWNYRMSLLDNPEW